MVGVPALGQTRAGVAVRSSRHPLTQVRPVRRGRAGQARRGWADSARRRAQVPDGALAARCWSQPLPRLPASRPGRDEVEVVPMGLHPPTMPRGPVVLVRAAKRPPARSGSLPGGQQPKRGPCPNTPPATAASPMRWCRNTEPVLDCAYEAFPARRGPRPRGRQGSDSSRARAVPRPRPARPPAPPPASSPRRPWPLPCGVRRAPPRSSPISFAHPLGDAGDAGGGRLSSRVHRKRNGSAQGIVAGILGLVRWRTGT
jgi:hypothetical protein